MPDFRRPVRRLTTSRLLTRGVSHVLVVGLVVSATVAGLANAQSADPTVAEGPGFFNIVSSVRGAAEPTQTARSTTLTLTAQPVDGPEILDRGAPAQLPIPEEPMPTPVPLDPDATPLAAPTTQLMATATATGPSARGTAPQAPVAVGGLVWPVPAGEISQYYHAGHLALDIAAPYGSQIVAAQAGIVTSAGWRNNGGGQVVSIDHGNGMVTVYNHLGSVWVSSGQYVAAGQGIGGVGCSGLCTGPHVHFEVIVRGIAQNPLRYY